MKRITPVFILALVLLICSCSRQHEQRASYSIDEDRMVLFENESDMQLISEEKLVVQDRKIIKHGKIYFETASLQETKELINKVVSDYKGYISGDELFDFDKQMRNRLEIRVPAENFENLLNTILNSAQKLDSKEISAQDVTEEFIDVEVRVKTKKELEARYKELLKRAVKVDEMLAIEREMGKLRSDIESVEGRLNYLKNKVAFSTLTVVYYEKSNSSSSFDFWKKLLDALKSGWEIILLFFLVLAKLWAFILLSVVVYFVVKYLRKRKKNHKKITI